MVRSKRIAVLTLAVLALVSCQSAGKPVAPAQADLASQLVRLKKPGPPPGPKDACWQSDVMPLMIETVSEQVMVSEEKRDAEGRILRPAAFRTETHQRIVKEREEIWFRSPCPAQMTVEFIASLQRALKARGLYLLPLTGIMDKATKTAIQRYQGERGLDSPRLSLAAARELGLITTRREDL